MLKYWLWLTTLQGMTPERLRILLDRFETPEQVYHAAPKERAALRSFEKFSMPMSLDRAQQIMERCTAKGIRMVTLQDAEYPAQLRYIPDPPGVLYVKGQLPLAERRIGIVGTRRPTDYGRVNAAKFAFSLAGQGLCIVSGMARGVDTAAHVGALQAGGVTIAVLGGGVDIVYPRENRDLYEDIIHSGAVLSEYPPGTAHEACHFPQRNRLISGLSLGVLIVEAPMRSGALITARQALEQGRDVFALPGNVDVPESQGCHRLIRDGAILAGTPADILLEYDLPTLPAQPDVRLAVEPSPKKKAPPSFEQEKEPARSILKLLSKQARTADELIRETGLGAQQIMAELTTLEIIGKIASPQGHHYMLVDN